MEESQLVKAVQIMFGQIEWACFALIMTIVDVLDSHLSEHSTEVLLYWNVNVVVSGLFI